MLSPDYLNKLPRRFVELMQGLDDFVIAEIARRVAGAVAYEVDEMPGAAEYQAAIARDLHISMERIEREIERVNGALPAMVREALSASCERALSADNAIYRRAGLQTAALKDSDKLLQYVKVGAHRVGETLRNQTGSLGFAEQVGGRVVFRPVAAFYQQVLDEAHLRVATGAANRQTAIRQAMRRMCAGGLRTVDYASGVTSQIDVAARRAILTGVSQTTGVICEQRADELGVTTMEIDAHAGSRPEHVVWQGRIVDRSGRDPRYLTLADIGYGTVTGFKGANCHHDWSPYIPGTKPRYTAHELRGIDPPPFAFEGRKYTAYEASQQQRKIENAMRRTKREIIACRAAGMDADAKIAQTRLQQQARKYKEFNAAGGLRPKNERVWVQGYRR